MYRMPRLVASLPYFETILGSASIYAGRPLHIILYFVRQTTRPTGLLHPVSGGGVLRHDTSIKVWEEVRSQQVYLTNQFLPQGSDDH